MATVKQAVPELSNPLDAVIVPLAIAVEEWKAANTEEKIKKNVTEQLNRASQEITMKLLGFNNRWDKWELDHCNGRSGESSAGDYLRNVQASAIKEWLGDLCMPTLKPALKAKLEKEMQQQYEELLYRSVRKKAETMANSHLDALIETLVTPQRLDAYLKASKLVNPTGE